MSRALTSVEVAEMWKEKVDQAEVGDQITPRHLDVVMKLKRKHFSDENALIDEALGDADRDDAELDSNREVRT